MMGRRQLPVNGAAASSSEASTSAQTDPSFAESMRRLRDCHWYWGPISWEEAEAVLSQREIGEFLIRDSASDRYIFTLSFKTADSVMHARLPQHGGRFCFGGPQSLVNADSLVEFVNETVRMSGDRDVHFLMHPKGELHEAVNIKLTTPVSRLSVMPALKHLCRFAILRALPNPEGCAVLPLPPHLLEYLRDPKYLAQV